MLTAAELMRSVVDSDDSAYRLSADYRLLEANTGFHRFARENGGVVDIERWRHESVLEAISGPLREFFEASFERARELGTLWQHPYECSSPERFRTFCMSVYPLAGEFVVVHSLRIESAHARASHTPNDELYLRDGFIKMCSNCRRVHNPSGRKSWDWVPRYLQRTPVAISHGLCETCAAFYWP